MAATDYEVGTGKTYADHSTAVGVILGAYGTSLYNDGLQRLLTYASATPSTKGDGTEYNETIYTNFTGYTTGKFAMEAQVPHNGQRGEGVILKAVGNPTGTTYGLRLNDTGYVYGYAFDNPVGATQYNGGVYVCYAYAGYILDKILVYDVDKAGSQVFGIRTARSALAYNLGVMNLTGLRVVGISAQSCVYNASVLNCWGNSYAYGIQQIFRPSGCCNSIVQGITGGSSGRANFASFPTYGSNVSDDATGGGLINQSAAQIAFNNYAAGTEDMRILLASVAKDYGTNYFHNTYLKKDIAMVDRHATDPWDSGAHTYVEIPVEGEERFINIGSTMNVERATFSPTGSSSIFAKRKSGIYVPRRVA